MNSKVKIRKQKNEPRESEEIKNSGRLGAKDQKHTFAVDMTSQLDTIFKRLRPCTVFQREQPYVSFWHHGIRSGKKKKKHVNNCLIRNESLLKLQS